MANAEFRGVWFTARGCKRLFWLNFKGHPLGSIKSTAQPNRELAALPSVHYCIRERKTP